jgi:hypothetical protein
MMHQTGTARTGRSARKQRPAAREEQVLPTQPERRPAATPEPQEVTTKLPRAVRSRRPAASNGGEVSSEKPVKRRLRRHADDDFGDFTYLHEPSESEPKAPEPRGRRGL